MSDTPARSPLTLPPTVNLHLVPNCNMACQYCYAHFLSSRSKPLLSLDAAKLMLADLTMLGVQRVTFAGGEPTLHPQLLGMLKAASGLGLVTAIVTNGRVIDQAWLEIHGPWLRWITLSVDSVRPETARELGRVGPAAYSHPDHVVAVARLVHAWNSIRPSARRIRLKLNITVTRANEAEDPSDFIRQVLPERVKVLEMLSVAGENDAASGLAPKPGAFDQYVSRIRVPSSVCLVRESAEMSDGSYAMIDPEGRFYQRVEGRYLTSKPIHVVGAKQAWAEVGGYDHAHFLARGGWYEPGLVACGNAPVLIAVEGLDGSGKSTVAKALAAHYDAVLVRNPPDSMREGREAADRSHPDARRAWYLAANHAAAAEAKENQQAGKAVVMDRSVASTLAFGAAEVGARVGLWPDSIAKPDLLVLLAVPEDVRQARIGARSDTRTAEESRLDTDRVFREAVLGNYLELGAVAIDASGAVEDIVQKIARLIDDPKEGGPLTI